MVVVVVVVVMLAQLGFWQIHLIARCNGCHAQWASDPKIIGLNVAYRSQITRSGKRLYAKRNEYTPHLRYAFWPSSLDRKK